MYENPVRISYYFGAHDFGAGAGAFAIKPPKGKKRGRVVDIHLAPTETFTQTTTPGYVRVGTAADADKYAELNCGAAAAHRCGPSTSRRSRPRSGWGRRASRPSRA